jgi:DNA-binding NtrC family response regulator
MPPQLATTAPPATLDHDSRSHVPVVALVITACDGEPWRVGESAFMTPSIRWIGRGGESITEFACFDKHRPGDPFPAHVGIAGCLHGDSISRKLWKTTVSGFEIDIENNGTAPMLHNGDEVTRATVRPGDTITSLGGVSFLCVLRPAAFPVLRHASVAHAFGELDAAGNVGEGPAIWAARDVATRLGRGTDYVLILGETGAGKSGLAKLVHMASRRAAREFVSHNAFNLTDSILMGDLFGKIANYPAPGPAIAGLLPTAEGGTLFLDEIANLSLAGQKALLTTLEDGRYKRIGEDTPRTLDVRFLGATNRDRSALQGDFHYRFTADLHIVPLRERREDIPLVARVMLRRRLAKNPELARLFTKGPSGAMYPTISVRLMDFLMRHELLGNARELDHLLGEAIGESHEGRIMMFSKERSLQSIRPAASERVPSGPVSSVAAPVSSAKGGKKSEQAPVVPLARERVVAALAAANGSVTKAADSLGVQRNKFYRAMEEMGLKPKGEKDGKGEE